MNSPSLPADGHTRPSPVDTACSFMCTWSLCPCHHTPGLYFKMPPLRKRDTSGEKEMMQINLRTADSSDNSSRPSTMNSDHNRGGYRPSARSLHTSYSVSRPYTGDYPGYSSSTLNVDSPNMSYCNPPSFAPHAYTDSQPNTRSSSPYPTPQTPYGFVSRTCSQSSASFVIGKKRALHERFGTRLTTCIA